VASEELIIESRGVRLALTARDASEDVLLAAASAALAVLRDKKQVPPSPPRSRGEGGTRKLASGGRQTDAIRAIARKVLADGHVHERREISKAVREAGLNPNPLNQALEGHFERGENVMGRPNLS
jgi:hypothetical protein